jgi:hypothetical protein
MGTQFWEYIGDNDAQLDHTNVFCHEAFDGKYVPRAAIFDLEPGVIGVVSASPGSLVNENAGP